MEENFEIEMQKLRDADPSATLQFSPSMSQNFVAPARVSSRRLIIGLLAIAVFAVPGYFSIFQNSGGGDNSSESAPDRLIELPRRATALSTTTTSTTTIPPFEFSENENIFVMTGTEGDVMQEVAPEGKVYTEVLFASYGNPTVTDGKLEQGSCHAENSMQIVAEAFVGKTNGVLTFDEATFGDPCVGTRKTFAVVLEYGDDPSPTTTTTVPETTTTTAVPETTTTLAPVTTTTLPENVAITLTGSRFYGESDSAIVWELACEGSAALCDWAKVRCEGNTLNISVSGTEVSDTAYTGSISLGDGGVPKPANVNFSGIASLTVMPRPVIVTPDSGLSKTYDAADPTLTYTTLGLISGDSLSGSLTRVVGENVGTYAISQGSVTTANNSNYTVTFSGTPVDFTIDELAVVVTPDSAQSKTYGAADPTFTYSVSPALVGTDSLTGALSRVTGSDVGTYAMTQGTVTTANNSNYTVTFSGTPVDFTINKLAVTVTADAKSKTYGSDDPTLTYTTSPSSISLSGALSRATGENVGSYAMTQGTVTTANNSNYTITFVGANLTISQRAVTVTADAKSKTYGDADPGLTYQLTGSLKSGDAFSGALTRVAGENAGEYNITQGSVALNSNYNITFVGAKLTISTRAVTVTADAKSKDFGGVDPALTYTLTSGSLKSGDSFTGALTRTAGENAGQYDITQGTVALNSNYTITFVGAKFTINGVTVTVTPVSGQQAEIGSGYKVQLVVTGLLGTDTYSGDAAYTDALGDQAITVGTLAVGSNYSLSFTPGVTVKVVAQLPISVTWRARNGSVNATGQASIGAKVEVTATGGGTGALTWSSTGGGCSLSVVDAITQTIQKNGNGTCTVTVRRAASSGRAASEVSQTFTWSNK